MKYGMPHEVTLPSEAESPSHAPSPLEIEDRNGATHHSAMGRS